MFIKNVRFLVGDINEVLTPFGRIFQNVYIFFPDPWPKKKHHKRRLINEKFCEALVRILNQDGEFLFKTDHEEYFEESMNTLQNFSLLHHIPWDNQNYYPVTDFERIWNNEGKRIYTARYKVKAQDS